MNKTFALAAAAAVLTIANTSLASQAEAGGGVRLQFGFPLGSFVARPCGSCGSSSYGSSDHGRYAAKRRAGAYAAAKAAERRAAIAEAKADAHRAKLAQARRLASAKKQNDAEEKVVAKADLETLAPDMAPLPVRAEGGQADVAIGEPKVILSGTTSEATQKREPAKKQEKVASAPVPAPLRVQAPVDCKKYVPSAGLTITVPCQ